MRRVILFVLRFIFSVIKGVCESPERFRAWSDAVLGFFLLVCIPVPVLHYAVNGEAKVLLISPVLLVLFLFTRPDRNPQRNGGRIEETQPQGAQSSQPARWRWLRIAIPIILLAAAPYAKGLQANAARIIAGLFEALKSDTKPSSPGPVAPKTLLKGEIVVPAPEPVPRGPVVETDPEKRRKFLRERAKLMSPPSVSGAGERSRQEKKAKPPNGKIGSGNGSGDID